MVLYTTQSQLRKVKVYVCAGDGVKADLLFKKEGGV